MNENLNLVEILKDCPNGTRLYSSVFGEVELDLVDVCAKYPIVIRLKDEGRGRESLTTEGKLFLEYEGECILFPSREQRDWSKFKVKKPKFDPKSLQAFDRVLVRDNCESEWQCDIFSHINYELEMFPYKCTGCSYRYCIPYNEETKHLVGSNKQAPEFYRYWED